MTETPATTPAPKLTAIQIIERELAGFTQQEAQTLSNLTAIRGAIQGAQHLLGVLKVAEQETQAEILKLAAEAKTAVIDMQGKVVEFAKKFEPKQ